MIAVKAMRYAGQWLSPGDEFEPKSERDARILRAIGKATDGKAPELEDKAEDDKPTKRAYRRKDMKAED
jgi:hypothetical protein